MIGAGFGPATGAGLAKLTLRAAGLPEEPLVAVVGAAGTMKNGAEDDEDVIFPVLNAGRSEFISSLGAQNTDLLVSKATLRRFWTRLWAT